MLKHFPGHGHGSGDSHKGTVVTPPLAQLRTVDLVPYRNLADYGPVAMMVGHLDVPDLTGGVPASISPAAYQLLRTEFGFTGLVLTDDLGAMKAITAQYSLPDAVLKALQAGADEALWSSGRPRGRGAEPAGAGRPVRGAAEDAGAGVGDAGAAQQGRVRLSLPRLLGGTPPT